MIRVVSFSCKHGKPPAGATVIDFRSLPNPHRVPALRDLDGRDEHVAEHFFKGGKVPMENLLRLAEKTDVIAFGCVGGKHRSVAVAIAVTEALRKIGGTCWSSTRLLPPEVEGRRGQEVGLWGSGVNMFCFIDFDWSSFSPTQKAAGGH